MLEFIVSCAGCGKKYKGAPSSKRFKCGACGNLFSFPSAAKTPANHRLACSNCWMEVEAPRVATPAPFACVGCNQKIHPQYGGRATPWAAGSSLNQSVSDRDTPDAILRERDELLARIRELEQNLNATQSSLGSAFAERDEAVSRLNQHQAELIQARTELTQFREMAVEALEPLGMEFSRRMCDLLNESDRLRTESQRFRGEIMGRLDWMERQAAHMREKTASLWRDMNDRFQCVLGTPTADQQQHARNEARSDAGQRPAAQVALPPADLQSAIVDVLPDDATAQNVR